MYSGEVALPAIVGKDTTSKVPQFDRFKTLRDTLKVYDESTGRDLFFMKTFKDEKTGEVTASEVLEAATVTARFRHISERNGEVDLYFDIIVPPSVCDSRWQVQLFPDLYALDDSVRLDPVIITGTEYRKAQLRGYQQYEKLMASLITDPNYYYERRNFEIFLARNLPEIYSLKGDTTIVSDESFRTRYGLSQQDILDHYSHKGRLRRNLRKKNRLTRMHDQLKTFIEKEGVRLDTVLVNENGTFTYEYVHTVKTKPGLKKVDIVLSGEVLEKGEVIYLIPRSKPFTFYISSTSTLASPEEKYLEKVTERRVAANLSIEVDFAIGRSDVDEKLGRNRHELGRARKVMSALLQDQVYDMDSIVVSAYCSPEGSLSFNDRLSLERGRSISSYLNDYVRAQQDSLEAEFGITMDENGNPVKFVRRSIPFISQSVGEDWLTLDMLVARDSTLSAQQKADYSALRDTRDIDRREYLMKGLDSYPYIRDSLYTKLRRVEFEFYLHRKGMVRDTVVTTTVDTVYRAGLKALEEMDYQTAANLLAPYKDYNTAVAAIGADRNHVALDILSKLPPSAKVHYLLAIVYSRFGDESTAVRHYLTACKLDRSMVFRGNLDPEISRLVKAYGLNRDDDSDL
ncbi:MAG: hypothetical protein IJ753_07530 [Bacteroidales bacterium]|nr:hypothetical protein [Bacteroidales bacterium]